MKITKAFRYRLRPEKLQGNLISQFAGSCRFVYNVGLALMIDTYKKENRTLNYSDLCKYLTGLKKEEQTSWLKNIHSQALQQSLKDLISSFQHFFRRVKTKKLEKNKNNNSFGFPRFKKKGNKDSFRFPQGVKLQNNKIFLPKVGWVRYFNSRPIEGVIAQVTVKREGKNWFVAIVCDIEMPIIHRASIAPEKAIGIDVGIKHFATLSNGKIIENPKYLKKDLKKLKHEQKNLSRKQKGSNNRKKQIIKVAKIHIDIKNSRNDFLHKVSTNIVKNHDIIAIESLNISGMIKNHKLAQSISDVSWNTFFGLLEYKAKWHGKHFVKIDPFYPSTKTCSSCNRKQNISLGERNYKCSSCGFFADRDLNASITIRSAGLAVLSPP